MGKNINRDYIIELVCRFDVPFCGNKFELVPQQREIFFYKHDRNQTIYAIIHDWDETLSLRMGLLYPLDKCKRIEEYEPELIGTEGHDTIFKIELNPEVLKTVGTFKYQMFAQDRDGKVLSSDIGKLKVKECL